MGDPRFHVENNCWVNDTNPEDRLVPVGAYFWRPAWCPGSGHLFLQEEPGLLYKQAMAYIEEDNYTAAESGFKQIIAGYPENKYAQASLKELFALNPALHDTDFTGLLLYCDSLSLNPGDSLLGTTADWLCVHCKIKNKQYQQAFNDLDSVLNNPGTLADSVFALIDLNYVYLKTLDSNNLKLSCITKNENMLAKTSEAYSIYRKNWIELLLKDSNVDPGHLPVPIQNQADHPPIQFTSIHPNPVAEAVNINYQVNREGTVILALFSITGQQMFSMDLGTPSPGEYSQMLSLIAIHQGIYMLTLSVNGAVCDRSKVIKLM